MAQVTVELDKTVPSTTRNILAGIPGIQVRSGARQSRLRINGDAIPLAVVSGRLWPLAQATAPILAQTAGPRKLGLVVADRLPEHVRRELEQAGCAYADRTGAAHFDVPGIFLHVEGRPGRRQQAAHPPTGLGVVGVRVVQSLLGEPERDWSVPALSTAAACSIGEAHKVLRRLEDERLVTPHGRARNLRRRVETPGDLLNWLSLVPAARRIREKLNVFIYSSDPSAVATYISKYAMDASLVYAFTGAAAARIWGAGATTSIPATMLRIHPDVLLTEAAEMLHARPVDSGANVTLVRDFGELGVHGRVRNGPAAMAVPVRVWLDMLGEPRGEDAAALFRESVLGW